VLAASALLLALGWWTYRAVESSLREIRAETMRNLLDAQVNGLRVWISEELGNAARIAREPRLREAAAQLARTPQCSGPARRQLEEVLRPLLRDIGDATFNVVGNGRLLATRFPEYCGAAAGKQYLAALEPVFQGKPRFVRPLSDAERVAQAPRLREGPPFAWIAAPIEGAAGTVIAVLALAQPTDGAFGSILSAGSFAFDEGGRVLSMEGFGQEAKSLKESKDGVLLDPYRNHHGQRVIGAWRWLPDLQMGVAREIAADEAYAPLRYLNIAFGVVFGALVIAVFVALGSMLWMARLRRQMGGGRRLGAYRLEKVIGEGGMATIYLARHDLLKRPTAVKLLKLQRATDEIIARFEREVQLASSLAHPNTVEIFDYGRTRDGRLYYAMEYLDGLTVADLIERGGPVPVARTLYILRQVCAGLAEAHGKGLVHRDIKPENIMVCRYGGEYDFVKILDFGLVKQLDTEHSRDLTRNLRILGTPLYMAPERLRNPGDVDARADIYAVGAVGFLMLSGRKVFESEDDLGLTTSVLNDEPPRVSSVAAQPVPFELDLAIAACLEKRREERPQRVGDLVEAFGALAIEHRWTQREAEAWWKENAPAS
jgi:serine/threonine-protein kinase